MNRTDMSLPRTRRGGRSSKDASMSALLTIVKLLNALDAATASAIVRSLRDQYLSEDV